MASIAEMKSDARARVRAQRADRSPQLREASARLLAQHAAAILPDEPVTVTAYRSMALEPGTGPLIDLLLARGHRVLLPRIVGRTLEWIQVHGDTEYARGPLGIMEPTGPTLPTSPSPLESAAVLFLPGLSVDRTGRRLGQGGGYYDSALSTVASHAQGGPLRVAVLFDEEVVGQVPHDDRDCLVDAVVTPGGITRLPTR